MNEANDIRILSWHPALQKDFEQLNSAWIKRDYTLEPIDIAVLGNPQEHIINHGGDIIFVAVDDKIAGTVAYKQLNEDTVEMTKMAVDDSFQGRKLGWLLGCTLLLRAAEAGFNRMVLYSNTKQAAAINMYRKLGFEEVELEKGGYERCNIKMAIALEPPPLGELSKKLWETVEATAEKLLRFSEEEAGEKKLPSKWSKKEILGHLIDSALNNYSRFVRAQHAEYVELPGYNQNFWVDVRGYQRTDWKEIINIWRIQNLHIVRILPLIPARALQHICVIGPNAPVSLQYIAEDYLRHLNHHLAQIFPVHANY